MQKKFQDLTIRDAFMFAAVMADEDQCRYLLEMVLGFKILSVTIIAEKTMSYHPEYHGIRLDILAEENGTRRRFNIEMQVRMFSALPLRCRYYHAQLDMDALLTGAGYDQLPDTYVIFICDFDPCGQQLYRYTFRSMCDETHMPFNDGAVTILLNTKGKNDQDTPPELIHFLKYVGNPQNSEMAVLEDDYVKAIKKQIQAIKRNRGWEANFMLLEEVLNDERKQARQEGREEGREEGQLSARQNAILEVLAVRGLVPESLRLKILAETDIETLKQWLLAAASATSVFDFEAQMNPSE